MMIRLNNDYNKGAHPKILEALINTNNEAFEGYGLDEWCEKGKELIKKEIDENNVDIHFLIGGTQTNFTLIAAALRPFQGVISANSGHINVHETGAIENTGHKIHSISAKNGKITAKDIESEAEKFENSNVKEHITQPKLVYISFPTEYGTLYSKKELTEIYNICQKHGLYLYIDGARMGYGLLAIENDLTLKDIAKLSDAFYIGGTKCGALLGEALVINNPNLKDNFRSYMKQNGAILAKGWIIGLEFYTLFKDGLYYKISKKAIDCAIKLKKAFIKKGIPFFIDSPTNQQFVILNDTQLEKLSQKYIFEYEEKLEENKHCVRFCTSWSTDEKEIDILINDILKL